MNIRVLGRTDPKVDIHFNVSFSSTPPLFFINVYVPSQQSVQSCILCVSWFRLCLFLQFLNWILEMFRQYGIFFFFILLVLRVFQMKGNMGYSDLDCMVDLHLFIHQCPIKVTIMILVNVVENVVKLAYSQSESSFSID